MSYVAVALSEAETVKYHALGGPAWFRLQVQQAAPPPRDQRGLYALTAAERAALLADLPALGRAATARKYRVHPRTVDHLRRSNLPAPA